MYPWYDVIKIALYLSDLSPQNKLLQTKNTPFYFKHREMIEKLNLQTYSNIKKNRNFLQTRNIAIAEEKSGWKHRKAVFWGPRMEPG